ncbi:site-specific integrase [Brucella pseudogrignonensis]|uniref:site-specific integrase n=1 Tax=Brucella pseudogrignonensis TaxID=419475 RepID=UPI0038D1CDB9
MNLIVEELRAVVESPTWFRRDDGICFQLFYEESRDLWIRDDGAEFIRNGKILADPFWIRIDLDVWRCRYLGRSHALKWRAHSLPKEMSRSIREALLIRLRFCAPSILSCWSQMLRQVSDLIANGNISCPHGFADISAGDLMNIMARMGWVEATEFRSVYRVLVALGAAGCSQDILSLLDELRLNRRQHLEHVATWHPEKGALTTSELETLRQYLLPPSYFETDIDHFCRVLLRTLVALGRRPSQLMGVLPQGVRIFEKDTAFPAVIEVPGAKHQRNNRIEWWPITADLYDDLRAFAGRPAIANAQQKFGYFFVTPSRKTSRPTGRMNGAVAGSLLSDWVARREIFSPRTGQCLHVTPTRLRHTVATQMARKGYALEDIQSFLEHDSDSAVLIYLDAVGSDLIPAIDRANDLLGDVFGKMAHVFFKGRIIDRPKSPISKPVVVPDPDKRAIIGQCGFAGSCPKHPFSACFNGCPHFLFFRDADISFARSHLIQQNDHWRASEASATRAKAHDDFARIDRALMEASAMAINSNE